MKPNNTIEINGNLYDAKTGKPINQPDKPINKTASVKHAKLRPQYVDGFRVAPRHKQPGSPQHPTSKLHIAKKAPEVTPSTKRAHVPAPKATTKPKQSATLHRKAVKRPVIQAEATHSAPKKVQSTAIKHADTARTKRALQIPKSAVISHFGYGKQSQDAATSTPLTQHIRNTHHTESTTTQATNHPTGTDTKERLIHKAVEKAVASTSAKKHRAKQSTTNHIGRYASTFAVAVLLAGYVAYLNVPSISMKVAASRAGFTASLPTYTPGGYSLKGPIAYTPGQVTIDFHANTDDRWFSIKQQPTTWDSVALLENFVSKQGKSYLTYQDRGLTIYIYNGSSAAWVNDGKMYSLEGKNSQLDTDQLLKLATSM